MKVARNVIFLAHIVIILLFIASHSYSHLQTLIVLILHYLVLKYDSSCYQNHCNIPNASKFQQRCLECNLPKWVRMRHCYKCQACVHKYDHHCVLMAICIGEFNHRFYLLFLVSFIWNVVKMLIILTYQMRDEVHINQLGVESNTALFYLYALVLVFLYFQLVLTGYLLSYHLYLCSNNTTTWQHVKRDTIGYMKDVCPQNAHPFSRGIFGNYAELFRVDPQHPINWNFPESQDTKPNSKRTNY